MNSEINLGSKPLYRASQFVWLMIIVVEILLVSRIIMKLFVDETVFGLANYVYSVTDPLANFFFGIFGVSHMQTNMFEWTTIVAGVVYGLGGFAIVKLLDTDKLPSRKIIQKKQAHV